MFALLRETESWNTHTTHSLWYYGYFSSRCPLPSQIGICGSIISSPTGVQGRAPAKTGFGAPGTWKNTSDGDKFRIFVTNIYPYFYDWKPMRSIFDILHKNFQEDQINSRFPGFPGGFLNSSRFPGVVDTLFIKCNPEITGHGFRKWIYKEFQCNMTLVSVCLRFGLWSTLCTVKNFIYLFIYIYLLSKSITGSPAVAKIANRTA